MTESACCRFCGGAFHLPALLEYAEAPQSAQGFLDSLEQQDDVVDLKIFQCERCGLVQHALPPVNYYRDVIRAVAFSDEMEEFRVLQLSKWVKHYELSGKKILEIGCGKGEYIELLAKAGAQSVSGLENSLDSVDFACQRGLDAKHGYLLPDMQNPWACKFDAFAIFSFIEHWPDLKGSLCALHNLLTVGAPGLVEVPSFDFIIKNGLYSEFTTDHIYYFDEKTLRAVLELTGFEVLRIESVWHNYILSAQVRKRVPLVTDNFKKQQVQIVAELHKFIGQFDARDVVVWGAGHQALAIMSLGSLRGKISHIVDSAGFKQQKYTPGTHLLIKGPDSLLLDLPKAIVIMAAAYSDEIARSIAQKYSEVSHVAILRENGLEIIKGGT